MRVITLALFLLAVAPLSAAEKKPADEWYTADRSAEAFDEARRLGKPVAVMLENPTSTCPLHNGQREQWKLMPEIKQFVRISRDFQLDLSESIRIRQEAADKAGATLPALYLYTHDRKYIDVIPYHTDEQQARGVAKGALSSNGPSLDVDSGNKVWSGLAKARALWSQEKFDESLKAYSPLMKLFAYNKTLAICTELGKDLPAIEERGNAEIAVADVIADAAKRKATLSRIMNAYKGFTVADAAKERAKAH
jgi:hypothetical protein